MSKYPKNLRKRGRIWWYRITHQGQTFEGSLETDNLTEARERLEIRRRELIETNWGKKPKRTFNEAAERFGQEHFKELKPKSARRYFVSIANLLKSFDGVLLEDITSARLNEFEQARKAQGVSASTIRRDLACLSVIFSFAEEWEWVTSNPVKPFLRNRKKKKGLEEGPARTRYLSHEEEAEILAHASPKARKAIIFALDTGLRLEEQRALEKRDIDLRARQVRVRAEVSKTSKERFVPLLPRVYQLVTEMLREDSLHSLYLFCTDEGNRYSSSSPYFYEELQKAVRRANKTRARKGLQPMEHVQWHDLRRTCGCRLLQDRGFSMEEVSKWLGHSSVKVTEKHYAFLRVHELHRAVERSEAEVVPLNRDNSWADTKVHQLPNASKSST